MGRREGERGGEEEERGGRERRGGEERREEIHITVEKNKLVNLK